MAEEPQHAELRALVVGGTGAVGKQLVSELLQSRSFSKVTTIGRREVPIPDNIPNKEKLEQHVVDMNNLSNSKAVFANHDVAFCCLGTTRKDAGSAEAFRKIDYDLVVEFARLSKENEIPHMNLVSSSGANANSFFLYMKTKGQAENELKRLEFPRLSIYRPPLLDRGADARTVEKIFKWVAPAMKAGDVAKAIKNVAIRQATTDKKTDRHVDIFETTQLRQLAALQME